MSRAAAQACANIALVKYWGKRDSALNLPDTGSLSLTLDALRTHTEVEFLDSLTKDTLVLDGQEGEATRISSWLDIVRGLSGETRFARVATKNNFPTASGLASSASGFAALALAASRASGLSLSPKELSQLARRGSGSAARSVFPGLVRLHRGSLDDGSDCFAEEVPYALPLRMVIAVVGGGKKKSIGSRSAMQHCKQTSPLYPAWVESVGKDIDAALSAIQLQDFRALGAIVRGSAMAMHATAMASRPPIRYWQPDTLRCLDLVETLEREGLAAYPTMDAGPHVKVLTSESDCGEVEAALRESDFVSQVIVSAPGPGAQLL